MHFFTILSGGRLAVSGLETIRKILGIGDLLYQDSYEIYDLFHISFHQSYYTFKLGSILQKFYTCNLQVQLLFSLREAIATLVKYKCKTFITLTPELLMSVMNGLH